MTNPSTQTGKTPGRNEPCPCGSGKKYKRCCGMSVPKSQLDAEGLLSSAQEFFQSGLYDDVLNITNRILGQDPNRAEANYLKGLVYAQREKFNEAEQCLSRACALSPDNPWIQANLGLVFQKLGENAKAISHCQESLRLAPGLADAHNTLGNALKAEHKLEDAIAHYREAVRIEKNNPFFSINLASALHAKKDYNNAEKYYLTTINIDQHFAEAYSNLAMLYQDKGENEKAEENIVRAKKLMPSNPVILNNYGLILHRQMNYKSAINEFKDAINILPAAAFFSNLGIVYEDIGDLQKSIDCHQKAINKDPSLQSAYINLGSAQEKSDNYDTAYSTYDQAIRNNPEFYRIYSNLIKVSERTGKLDRAYECSIKVLNDLEHLWMAIGAAVSVFGLVCDWEKRDKALVIQKDLQCKILDDYGVLAMAFLEYNYSGTFSTHTLFSLHQKTGSFIEENTNRHSINASLKEHKKGGKIRIGYLSADFRKHSVGFFIRNVIECHDPDKFSVYCYFNNNDDNEDELTRLIRDKAESFQKVKEESDITLARRITSDNIDILVDLAGYTAGTRLPVFAYKPAPIQISYLGYPDTSGLQSMDYRISDPYVDTDEGTQYTETLLKMPECFICFGSFPSTPKKRNTPFQKNGYITFGSFNNVKKITPQDIKIWSSILSRLTDAKIVIKAKGIASDITRHNIHSEFSKAGISPDRINLIDHLPDQQSHLDYYNNIDFALDPLSYNGATTTCEALWMGVPVITCVGKRHAQRVSYSILKNIGIEDTIAHNVEEYIEIAVRLAENTEKQLQLRKELSRKLRASILCDPIKFTKQLEDLYRNAVKRVASSQ